MPRVKYFICTALKGQSAAAQTILWEGPMLRLEPRTGDLEAIAELVSTCASESRGMEAGGSSRLPKPPSSGGPSGSTDRRLYSGHREGGRGQGRRGRGFRH